MPEAGQPEDPAWQPTAFKRFIKAFATSTSTVHIVTDAGPAYVKALGNQQGPQALACDLVGTGLARWFGLQTFSYAILTIEADDDIPFFDGSQAAPGPAFATRAETGSPWSGDPKDLLGLDNPEDIARLVVFDNWLLNCDRYPPDPTTRKPNYDNVFLSSEGASPGRVRLMAMDHGHCFTCGREITAKAATIDVIRDERSYGLFPEFRALANRATIGECVAQLGKLPEELAADLVGAIPAEWDVSDGARDALVALIRDRAAFLAADPETAAMRILGA